MDADGGGFDATVVGPADLLVIRATSDEARADGWALVLASAAIRHEVVRASSRFMLRVLAIDYELAERALDAYDSEEASRVAEGMALARSLDDAASLEPRSHAGLAVAALLAAFYAVTGSRGAGSWWFERGASVAELVRQGEWWRATTALTLHADAAHLASNAVASAVFVTALCRRVGTGAGALLVLVAGFLGNLANAYAHGAHHASNGFSTAVFAAIGLLGGLELSRRTRARRGGARRLAAWPALAASVALLGLLGSDKQSDVFAHLFGFTAGVVLGVAWGALGLRVRSFAIQALLAVLALGALGASWVSAWATAPSP